MYCKLLLAAFLTAATARAQKPGPAPASSAGAPPVLAMVNPVARTNPPAASPELAERVRTECIQNRRMICGQIMKILPDGLVVDSGFTNLLRQPLVRSWLVPGTVTATRATDFVEGNSPDSVCVGLVYLTDIPKSRRARPRLYDYVIIEAYPAGKITYRSLGTIHRTVRRYSAVLENAVDLVLAADRAAPPAASAK